MKGFHIPIVAVSTHTKENLIGETALVKHRKLSNEIQTKLFNFVILVGLFSYTSYIATFSSLWLSRVCS